MKRRVILLMVLVCAIGAYVYYEKYQQAQQMINPVLYGNVDIRSVNLAFRQTGRLQDMLVDEGDRVKKGQLLAQLDGQPFKDTFAIAQANLRLAKAQLAKVLSGSRSQDIEVAYQEIQRLKATLTLANTTLKRQERLRKTGAVSQGAVDNARATYKEVTAALAAAEQKFSLLEEGADKEEIAIAYAQVDIAQQQVNSAQTTLDETKLYAPDDAWVQTRILEPGSIVGMNTPLLSLAIRMPVYIRAYVDEPLLGRLSLGQKVTIYTDSGDTRYHGHIGFISGSAEFTPKTVETTSLRTDLVYRVRILVDGEAKGLNQGQPVTVKLNSGEK